MENISDHLTQITNAEDKQFLRSELFPVNMRLFKSSAEYKQLIHKICDHLVWLAKTKFAKYKKPHGMSGANAGIPFNIIGIVKQRGTADEFVEIMINPRILGVLGKRVKTQSNCGSIRLANPIEILRHEIVRVQYYDFTGQLQEKNFDRESGGFTIQHEIDHNLGTLITDYVG